MKKPGVALVFLFSLTAALSGVSRSAGAADLAAEDSAQNLDSPVGIPALGSFSKIAISIGGTPLSGSIESASFENETEVVEYKDGEDQTTRYRPGNNKTTRIKITREWSNDSFFHDWYQAASQSSTDRKQRGKTMELVVYDRAGKTSGTFVLSAAWPFKWTLSQKSMGSSHAVESVELVYENFDYKK